MRFLIFFSVFLSLDASIHWYIYQRLFADPEWQNPVPQIGAVIIVGLAVALPLRLMMRRRLPQWVVQPSSLIIYTWMGASFYLVVLLGGLDLFRAVARWVVGDAMVSSRFVAMVSGTVATTGTALALRSGLGEVDVKEVPVQLAKLPRTLSGLTVIQLSDVHIGHRIGRGFLPGLVEKVNAQKPDLIVITGDLVDGSIEALRDQVMILGGLRSRFGTYFVTGNHEYYSGAVPWIEELDRLGMRTLRNEHVWIGDDGGRFQLAGVDDQHGRGLAPGHGCDVDKALEGIDPEQELVLLAHQPVTIGRAEGRGVGLQLSGHTHGGQIWPFGALVKLNQPYLAGLHQHDAETQIYVSCGTGYWGPPMRLLAPAEITKVVLTSSR